MTLSAYLPKGAETIALLRMVQMIFKGAPAVPVYTNAGVPTNGTSGTLAGVADPGSHLINTTAKTFYINTNTKASPTWTIQTAASGTGAFSGTFDGLVGSITPAAAVATTIAGTDATDSTTSTTGALLTAGGLGVAKAANIGTNLAVAGATDSTTTTTGSLQTAGGLGVAKAATIGTLLTAGSAKIDTGTKTAAATSGAATLNKNAGRITSEALTTGAGLTYTLTLTNSAIAAADVVLAVVGNGTNSAGTPDICSVTPAAGSVVIVVQNVHATTALNGTLIINFVVFKA